MGSQWVVKQGDLYLAFSGLSGWYFTAAQGRAYRFSNKEYASASACRLWKEMAGPQARVVKLVPKETLQ